MQTVVVRVRTLLNNLRENRKEHKETYEEALQGYKQEAVAALEDRLNIAKETGKINLYFDLTPPTNNLKDYDRVIQMLEMTPETEVKLTQQEFGSYVQDDWQWKQNFIRSNALYSSKAANTFLEVGE